MNTQTINITCTAHLTENHQLNMNISDNYLIVNMCIFYITYTEIYYRGNINSLYNELTPNNFKTSAYEI